MVPWEITGLFIFIRYRIRNIDPSWDSGATQVFPGPRLASTLFSVPAGERVFRSLLRGKDINESEDFKRTRPSNSSC